jgi:hypothetical protein
LIVSNYVVANAAGNRAAVRWTVTYIYTRATRCSLAINKRISVDATDTSAPREDATEWYYLWGLHVDPAITDRKYTPGAPIHTTVNGASNTNTSGTMTEVLNLDHIFAGDLKLYPALPYNVPAAAPFAFPNSEVATRVVRAIDHAAELCGASSDPFAR